MAFSSAENFTLGQIEDKDVEQLEIVAWPKKVTSSGSSQGKEEPRSERVLASPSKKPRRDLSQTPATPVDPSTRNQPPIPSGKFGGVDRLSLRSDASHTILISTAREYFGFETWDDVKEMIYCAFNMKQEEPANETP